MAWEYDLTEDLCVHCCVSWEAPKVVSRTVSRTEEFPWQGSCPPGLAWSNHVVRCSVFVVTGSPAVCWCGHHRHSRTTFYNRYTLVSEYTLVVPKYSVQVFQSIPLRTKLRWLISHTPAKGLNKRAPLMWAATGPQKRVTLLLEHVAKADPQLIGRNSQIGLQ